MDDYIHENEISIEQLHHTINITMDYIFEKYKMLNSLLGYLLANDYEGLLIMSQKEWNENIFQHNFSTGWRLSKEDKSIYIVGKENK